MHTGAITNYIDVAQLALYGFWIFFAGLIFYLRGEDKREGYPLETEYAGRRGKVQGFPPMPRPKTFLLQHGGLRVVPDYNRDAPVVAAQPAGAWIGSPLEPTGNPMRDGIGPAAYAHRSDTPDLTLEGLPRIVPLRVAPGFHLDASDPDPRGMTVRAADGQIGGVVTDVWVDRSESVARYLEVEVNASAGMSHVLLPINFVRIERRTKRVRVKSITAEQFAFVPAIKKPDEVTLLEEDRIMAYYASGHLYAKASRMGPLL